MLKLINLKRSMLVALFAGLALGAQSAVADTLWFYEGHGWLPQPPLTGSHSRQATVIAGDDDPYPDFATESERPPFVVPDDGRPVTATRPAPRRHMVIPAPYNTGRGYFN